MREDWLEIVAHAAHSTSQLHLSKRVWGLLLQYWIRSCANGVLSEGYCAAWIQRKTNSLGERCHKKYTRDAEILFPPFFFSTSSLFMQLFGDVPQASFFYTSVCSPTLLLWKYRVDSPEFPVEATQLDNAQREDFLKINLQGSALQHLSTALGIPKLVNTQNLAAGLHWLVSPQASLPEQNVSSTLAALQRI